MKKLRDKIMVRVIMVILRLVIQAFLWSLTNQIGLIVTFVFHWIISLLHCYLETAFLVANQTFTNTPHQGSKLTFLVRRQLATDPKILVARS